MFCKSMSEFYISRCIVMVFISNIPEIHTISYKYDQLWSPDWRMTLEQNFPYLGNSQIIMTEKVAIQLSGKKHLKLILQTCPFVFIYIIGVHNYMQLCLNIKIEKWAKK